MNYHSCRQAAAVGTNKFLDQGSNIQNKHLLKNFKKYLVLVLQFFALFSFSQTWEGYFSYLNTSEVVYANGKIYASADNAIFSYDILSQDLETIPTIEGLSGDFISTFHYSTNYQLLIIGYENGLI